jgi:ribonuclease H / adenosylcobalamin/alpha-ribazole phosphatase
VASNLLDGPHHPSSKTIGKEFDVMHKAPEGTTILLVRHGETTLNLHGQFRGRADPPLTVHGAAQARAVAQALKPWRPASVLASPRLRATQTASEIGVANSCSVDIDARLDDIDYGQWTGLPRSEVASRWQEEFRRWMVAPEGLQLPGGEEVAHVAERVTSAVLDIAALRAGAATVLLTHDVAIRLVLCRLLMAPLAAMHRIRIGLTSITVLGMDDALFIERVNDCRHLDAMDVAPGG